MIWKMYMPVRKILFPSKALFISAISVSVTCKDFQNRWDQRLLFFSSFISNSAPAQPGRCVPYSLRCQLRGKGNISAFRPWAAWAPAAKRGEDFLVVGLETKHCPKGLWCLSFVLNFTKLRNSWKNRTLSHKPDTCKIPTCVTLAD